jgi:hypothetical protein
MALSSTQRRVNRVTNVNNLNRSYARQGGSRRQTALDAAAYFAPDARAARNIGRRKSLGGQGG